MGLRHFLDECQHHANGVFRHGFGIAAGLVHQKHAGLGAGIRIDRVISRALGCHHQQIGQAPQQRIIHVKRLGQFIARCAHIIAITGGKFRKCCFFPIFQGKAHHFQGWVSGGGFQKAWMRHAFQIGDAEWLIDCGQVYFPLAQGRGC